MKVHVVSNEQEMNDAYTVRAEVFIKEQQVPEEEEMDQFESASTHFVIYDDSLPIGAGRFRNVDGYGKIERICVIKPYRKKGAGKKIMDTIEEEAAKQGFTKLKLNAQTHAEVFYKNLGYETISDIFMDAGIPHVTMIKNINSK